MAIILHIETATPVCSVALTDNERILAIRETSEKNAHSQVVTVFIDEIFRNCGLLPYQLDAISVSKGPGSYTGLRIGVSTAKGICWALDKPMISVGTPEAMALGMREKYTQKEKLPILFAPMIDARRMEVYTGLFDEDLNNIRPVYAAIIEENTFDAFIENHIICFAGDGAEKCESVFTHPNFRFMNDFQASSAYLARLASAKFADGNFEDVAYFEPFYLKDFIAGKPNVKGLR
ncbi:MAG: tRNA (adenosine(37)-N6)-threonylcarbamoyltransferase complex dimerization subunit type 1 TsaB [Lentimicrobium sp.]|jgi:tRNA threonylcarbamoyladenosine biosynthesis protein TsaB|nr:tRNA (adenosine(37)-N6)-threonylcarbamoyltransferase complex dimerization subunit type 1 TsaB [Lentimicrobium sp.]